LASVVGPEAAREQVAELHRQVAHLQRVPQRAWPTPTFRLAQFEDRAVPSRTKAPVRQKRGQHWLDLHLGDGTVSNGFPLELPLRRHPRLHSPLAVPGVEDAAEGRPLVVDQEAVVAVEPEVEPEAERQAPRRKPVEPLVQFLQRQLSRLWMDSNRPGPQSHWHGASWILTPPPEPVCRHNPSPYTTNSASWKGQKQRTELVIAPR
jgi:hypothetical protein